MLMFRNVKMWFMHSTPLVFRECSAMEIVLNLNYWVILGEMELVDMMESMAEVWYATWSMYWQTTIHISRCVSKVCPPRQSSWLSNRCGQLILHFWPNSCTVISTSTTVLSGVFSTICTAFSFIWLSSAKCSSTLWPTSLWCTVFLNS